RPGGLGRLSLGPQALLLLKGTLRDGRRGRLRRSGRSRLGGGACAGLLPGGRLAGLVTGRRRRGGHGRGPSLVYLSTAVVTYCRPYRPAFAFTCPISPPFRH